MIILLPVRLVQSRRIALPRHGCCTVLAIIPRGLSSKACHFLPFSLALNTALSKEEGEWGLLRYSSQNPTSTLFHFDIRFLYARQTDEVSEE
jgi:hypothetical protein